MRICYISGNSLKGSLGEQQRLAFYEDFVDYVSEASSCCACLFPRGIFWCHSMLNALSGASSSSESMLVVENLLGVICL